mmetsp:Transcript_23193/g.44173  ORF Transcript_23193/g.44173 Transcript_23193/m.44173 type:complete len:169 (-) Transcript_23193:73-579(-)|eukprot:scaffold1294_cov167-Amphora_coffeaeformis.AAC.9
MCNSISISAYKARIRSLAAAKASRSMKPKLKGDSGNFGQGLKVLSEAAVVVQEKSLSSKYQEKVTQRPPQSGQQQGRVRPLSHDECEEILDNIFKDMDSSFFFTPKTTSNEATNPTHSHQSQARLANNVVATVNNNKCRSMNHETETMSVRCTPMYTTSTLSRHPMQV